MALQADTNRPSQHATAWLLTGTLVFALFVPVLAQRGMTWDGVLYATISRNMAVGIGDAWHPKITETLLPDFHEHPPLAFWLQSLPFRLLGDHFWVERLYSVSTGIITGAIFVGLWRLLLRGHAEGAACSWLMILLWVACSHWAYRNNILENTLGIWTALSVYASVRALDEARLSIAWAALAGLAVSAALMTKGPVGLFPAVTPAIAWLTLRRGPFSKAALVQIVVVVSCAGSFAIILSADVSREYWQTYWRQQVMASLQADREGLASSFVGQLRILQFLAEDLTVGVAIAAMLTLLAPRRFWMALRDPRLATPLAFCLLTAFSASLPLVASPKQHGHYTAPSWPFFAFALALGCLPAVLALLPRLVWLDDRRGRMLLRSIAAAVTLIAAGYGAARFGGCHRDRSDIEASDAIARAVGPQVIIAVPHEVWDRIGGDRQFRLHAYLYRDHYISVWQPEPDPEQVAIHMRLQPPDPALRPATEPITLPDGFACYPLRVPPGPPVPQIATRPGHRR
jgi:4-amino-4-deoxy-L-arabinose transferase-like glycosyltransferase